MKKVEYALQIKIGWSGIKWLDSATCRSEKELLREWQMLPKNCENLKNFRRIKRTTTVTEEVLK